MAKILFIRERVDQHCPVSLQLRDEGHEVACLPGSNVALFKPLEFHCVVIDVNLDARGIKLVKVIHAMHPETGIILLLRTEGLIGKRVIALLGGADICEAKSLSPSIFLAFIASITRRFSHALWRLDLNASKLHAPNGDAELLTSREMAVLKLLTASAGHLVPRSVLAEALRKKSPTFEDRSIDQLISRLRRKWHDGIRRDLPIKTEHGIGYRFSEKIQIL